MKVQLCFSNGSNSPQTWKLNGSNTDISIQARENTSYHEHTISKTDPLTIDVTTATNPTGTQNTVHAISDGHVVLGPGNLWRIAESNSGYDITCRLS